MKDNACAAVIITELLQVQEFTVHLNVEPCHMTADSQILAVSPPVAVTVYINHFAIYLLLSSKAETHFTVPWRVEG